MSDYKTCTHTYDSGRTCHSAAARGRDFCGYHLRYRGRLLRMAQYRARHQRFDITLPPLDSLCSIQSALCQVAEALAADMIDPRRAQGLLKALRFAKENLKDSLKENADWHATPYLSEDAQAYDNFESDYGLPSNVDVSAPPEVSFPPPPEDLRAPQFPDFGNCGDARSPLIPEIPPPYVRDYVAEAEAAFECKPEDIELNEILKTQGYKAFDRRAREHQRNDERRKQRRLFRANYARYAAEAKAKNIQCAAEKLLAERRAAEHAAAAQPTTMSEPDASKKPPASAAQFTPEQVKNTA